MAESGYPTILVLEIQRNLNLMQIKAESSGGKKKTSHTHNITLFKNSVMIEITITPLSVNEILR